MLTWQYQIVIACCCLHNFIRKHANDDPWFQQMEDPNVVQDTTSHGHATENAPNIVVSQDEIALMSQLKDVIANQLWHDTTTWVFAFAKLGSMVYYQGSCIIE